MSYTVNPDEEYAAEIKRAIKKNSGYCVSAMEKTKDTKCPCKEFREQESGMCSCGLYIKEK